jgi:tetratricopeptide (TPR) repeat protein
MIEIIQPTWEHAQSRFQRVTEGVIHQLQSDFFAGRNLGDSNPDVSSEDAAVMVAESLEADVIWNIDPQELLQGAIKKRRECDFLNAALAEILFAVSDTARENKTTEVAKSWWAFAMASLEEIAKSPTASPMLDYEEIFWELSQKSRDEKNDEAIDWLKRGLAYNLHFENGSNAISILRDIAELYLQAGQFDQGLQILTAVLHQDPADIWTYNIMAISFDRYGLARLGSQAIQRGLQLIEIEGDEEGLRSQLESCQKDMKASKVKDLESEITPLVLTRFRDALSLDFEAGQPVSIPLLCRELVPNLDRVPVKRALTSQEFPLPKPDHILSQLLESLNEKSIGKKGRSRKRHKRGKDRGKNTS